MLTSLLEKLGWNSYSKITKETIIVGPGVNGKTNQRLARITTTNCDLMSITTKMISTGQFTDLCRVVEELKAEF